MSEDHNVAFSVSTAVLAMDIPDFSDNLINSGSHLLGAFAVWAAISPNGPPRVLFQNLMRLESFVVAIVPLADLLGDLVGRGLRNVFKEEMEGLVRAPAG